jgi:hypothetical protein
MKSTTPIVPNPCTREALKAAIKSAVREMIFSAAANPSRLPPADRAKLAILDILLNPSADPPEGDAAQVIRNRGLVKQVDGILGKIAGKAPAKPKKRTRRK